MRTIKLLTCASSVCLLVAATSVLANSNETQHPNNKAHQPVVVKHTKAVKKTTAVKKSKVSHKSPATTSAKKIAPINKNANKAPAVLPEKKLAPVNMAHKYFGFGPQSRIQINGFMSAGFSGTNAKNGAKYDIPGHGQIGNKIGFAQNSLAGLQFTGNITPKLSAVVQVDATGENDNGKKYYRPSVDWAFIRYKLNNKIQFRVGRMRIPDYMYAQTEEVGLTYVPVFLPPEVYRIVPFYNFNGADMTFTQRLGHSNWTVKLNPFFGENTSQFDMYTKKGSLIPQGTTATFHENMFYGGAIDIGNQYITIHGSYAHTDLSMDLPGFNAFPQGPKGPSVYVPAQKNVDIGGKSASFYGVGARLDWHNIVAATEFAHRQTPDAIASLSGYYAMLGYRIDKVLPYVTYARMWTTNMKQLANTPNSEAPEAQESFGAGINYYINSNLVLKTGINRITPTDGTNGLFTTNPGVKHVWMYTAGLDVVF